MFFRKKRFKVSDFMEIDPDDITEVSIKLKNGDVVSCPDPPCKKSVLHSLKTDLNWLLGR